MPIKHKRIIAVILLVLISLNLSGCWGRRETQEMSLSTALGFDKTMINDKSQFRLTVVSTRPPQGVSSNDSSIISESQKGSAGQVISIVGDSIWEAGRNWSLRASRKLFLGQAQLAVIGEDAAREGIVQILDFLNRHQDLRERVSIVICQGSAADFLNAQPEYEPTVSNEIDGILKDTWRRTGKVKDTELFHVSYDLLTTGKEAVIPYMMVLVPPEPSSPIRQNPADNPGQASADQSSHEQEQNNIQPQNKSFVVAGAAVLKGDQMVGLLNEEESQGLLFLNNQIKTAAITLNVDGTENNASIRLKSSRTQIKPVLNQEKLVMDVSIKAEGDLMEVNNAIDKVSKEDFQKVETAASTEIENRCRKALAKSQELKSDVFGFGDKIHRSNPREWKQIKEQWDEIFPTVQINIKVEFKLKQTGIKNDPLTIQ